MLWTSFAAETDKVIQEVKTGMPGLQIISYRRFSLPVHRYEVCYKLSGSVAPDMIEELVLDSLSAGFTFPVTREFIASALGLDVVFIENAIKKLIRLKVVTSDNNGALSLTLRGRVYAENNLIPGGEAEHEISFYYDRKFGGRYIKAEGSAKVYDKFEQVDEYVTDKTKFISPPLISEIGEKQGKKIENPEKGELICGFVSSEITGNGLVDFLEIWVYDFVNRKIFCRVWDCENGEFSKELTRFAETYTYMNEITNPEKYIQLKSSNCERETMYTDFARSVYSAARFENTAVDDDSPVRIAESDEEIVIPESRGLIIMSPWLYPEVLSDDLLGRINKAQYTLFGYGDGTAPDMQCVEKLLEITDENGIPKVLPCYIKGIKEKEILAEDILHCVGSVDYSENADDYYSPAESVYMVRDAECLDLAKKRLSAAFLSAIGNGGINSERFVIAVLNICSYLLSEEDFEKYINEMISVSEGETLYNIYLLLKRKKLISEENFNEKIVMFDKLGDGDFKFQELT